MSEAPFLSIGAMRSAVAEGPVAASVSAQLEGLLRKESSNGKPYWEARLRDAADSLVLRAWSDTDAFRDLGQLAEGDFVTIEGEFLVNGTFGPDARRWRVRRLEGEAIERLLLGGDDLREAMEADFRDVSRMVEEMGDPRLRALCLLFIEEHGDRFRRAAAARRNHHARRGGLLGHTGQMMRSASALCGVYTGLNRDLLLAGVLFHDCGKLWETCPPEQGFVIAREQRGELLGHITIGIEVANVLWRKLPLDEWKDLAPASEEVRLHLLHLIASHHGELQFGSPVEPKTPEAIALHMIDNLDARIEMLHGAYASRPEVAPGIHDRVHPLNTHPVRPLAPCGRPGGGD
jgi:3'-5' exoribonuclease